METITSRSLDDLFSSMPTGSLERAILNNLVGIDHRQTPGMVPINKDMPGYTFFTRPQLNMQRDNLRNIRQLASLLSRNPLSIQMYIRSILDPRLGYPGVYFGRNERPLTPEYCPIIDNLSPFIPILTNNLVSMSGWPSLSVPTRTSDPGLMNEQQTLVDGVVLNKETFDITANFRNTRGDPVLYLFYTWALYMAGVFQGTLVPYLDMIARNEIDYNTRIYRLVMDHTKTRVTKIACTVASIPVGVPIGDAFDIPGDKPYSEANREISMRFKCDGVRYYDDLTAYDFNKLVCIFNPNMYESIRGNSYIKIPTKLLDMFNRSRCYPWINLETSELEWWIDARFYNKIVQKYIDLIPQTNSEDYTGD